MWLVDLAVGTGIFLVIWLGIRAFLEWRVPTENLRREMEGLPPIRKHCDGDEPLVLTEADVVKPPPPSKPAEVDAWKSRWESRTKQLDDGSRNA